MISPDWSIRRISSLNLCTQGELSGKAKATRSMKKVSVESAQSQVPVLRRSSSAITSSSDSGPR